MILISLKDIDDQIKAYYKSDTDNLLENFYIKALSESVYYRRVTGTFSSSILAGAAKGISNFIKNDGKMELICWATLSERDVKAIERGEKEPEKVIEEVSLEKLELDGIEDELKKDHLKALSWMVANDNLEIKIAVKKDEYGNHIPGIKETTGEFHAKSGILKDKEENEILFCGSENESISGWKHNIEEFHVFKSWDEKEKNHFQPHRETMELYWENEANKVEVFDFPEALKEELINYAPPSKEEIIKSELERRLSSQIKRKDPIISDKLSISPWDHQQRALESLKGNDFKGIFKMATGTGKTFTALFGLNEYIKKEGEGKRILIIVHRNALKKQWKKTLIKNLKRNNLIFTYPEANVGDLTKIWDEIDNNNNVFLISTIQSLDKLFKKLASKPDFVIGDEVHNYGTVNYSNKIKNNLSPVENKLGLSATPERYYDQEGTDRILDYFGDIIFEYGINEAQKDGILADYNYYVYPIRLTQEEEEDFEYWTNQIKKDVARKLDNELWTEEGDSPIEDLNTYNLIQRANIIKQANNKFVALRKILSEWDDKLNQCIVYFNEREQLQQGQEVFEDLNIDSYIIYHSFIDNEDQALDIFRENNVRYVLSMKCLDEGIDIPSCDSMILLSCSKNPRKYVQRRGRVLRNSEKKEKIVRIFDVVAFPNNPDPSYGSLVLSYLSRPWEFIDKALNINERRKLHKYMEEYGITSNELDNIIEEW